MANGQETKTTVMNGYVPIVGMSEQNYLPLAGSTTALPREFEVALSAVDHPLPSGSASRGVRLAKPAKITVTESLQEYWGSDGRFYPCAAGFEPFELDIDLNATVTVAANQQYVLRIVAVSSPYDHVDVRLTISGTVDITGSTAIKTFTAIVDRHAE